MPQPNSFLKPTSLVELKVDQIRTGPPLSLRISAESDGASRESTIQWLETTILADLHVPY
jgi:hypothetical protein